MTITHQQMKLPVGKKKAVLHMEDQDPLAELWNGIFLFQGTKLLNLVQGTGF